MYRKDNYMAKKQIVTLMASLVIIAGATLLLSVDSYAQRMRMSLDDRVNALKEKLSLTKAQTDSVRVICEVANKERSDAFQAHSGDRGAMREEMQKIMESTDKKIEALLTDEQKKKYDE